MTMPRPISNDLLLCLMERGDRVNIYRSAGGIFEKIYSGEEERALPFVAAYTRAVSLFLVPYDSFSGLYTPDIEGKSVQDCLDA